MNKTLLRILIIFCLTIASCSDDNDFTSTPKNPEVIDPIDGEPTTIDLSSNFGAEVSKNFIGQIIDTQRNPIEGAEITIGEESVTTDTRGIFILKNAPVFEKFAYIKVTKTGYVNGSRAVVPTQGTNHIEVMLLEKNITATIQSGNAAVVNTDDGAKVEFEGAYTNAQTEENYTGAVKVSMHHLNPSDENMRSQMPGMLYAANSQNEERMLQTFGMLAVELEGENGEKLNLTEGSTATIHMPLDAELIATAPTTIPLWHFDEQKGYWIEDGEATLQGNEYVGTVSHFSFWNCDIPAEAVNYCLTLENEDGEILANTTVSITSATYGTTYGQTNEEGEVCGLVPMGEDLTLDIYSGNYYSVCNDIFFSTEIGSFSQDTEETLSVEVPNELEVSVTATILNCDATPLAEGYVTIKTGTYSYNTIYIENGELATTFLLCNENYTIELEAINMNSLASSGELEYTLAEGNNNLGIITACENEIEEFIQYSIDDGETDNVLILEEIDAVFDPNAQVPNKNLEISTPYNNQCFWLRGNLTSPFIGEYTTVDNYSEPGFIFIEECPIYEGDVVFNVTNIGEIGEYIDINFSGDYLDWNEDTHSITGTIHVLRDE
ncbi:hypothetical protein [Mesonia aestuariivivens]|uniref:Carboxypeptidase regulatory-like domain-containing protein n=1 Tax=Mesonia aestuariivivens TaxID=2796128 RepID=A0ABS6W474_9FLAO|nr:hypothetical protein [Mesonia aestuariivivens]MBW2962676.1 hypothetical protein [Mesonia aestuariivivens]